MAADGSMTRVEESKVLTWRRGLCGGGGAGRRREVRGAAAQAPVQQGNAAPVREPLPRRSPMQRRGPGAATGTRCSRSRRGVAVGRGDGRRCRDGGRRPGRAAGALAGLPVRSEAGKEGRVSVRMPDGGGGAGGAAPAAGPIPPEGSSPARAERPAWLAPRRLPMGLRLRTARHGRRVAITPGEWRRGSRAGPRWGTACASSRQRCGGGLRWGWVWRRGGLCCGRARRRGGRWQHGWVGRRSSEWRRSSG